MKKHSGLALASWHTACFMAILKLYELCDLLSWSHVCLIRATMDMYESRPSKDLWKLSTVLHIVTACKPRGRIISVLEDSRYWMLKFPPWKQSHRTIDLPQRRWILSRVSETCMCMGVRKYNLICEVKRPKCLNHSRIWDDKMPNLELIRPTPSQLIALSWDCHIHCLLPFKQKWSNYLQIFQVKHQRSHLEVHCCKFQFRYLLWVDWITTNACHLIPRL